MRLAGASGQSAAGLLGMQSGSDYWLLNLADSGEVIPLSTLTGVPLTQPWFAGIANIRGNLYSVVDFSAFQGKEATPQNGNSRLLIGTTAAMRRCSRRACLSEQHRRPDTDGARPCGARVGQRELYG